jgi:hypothetical protein
MLVVLAVRDYDIMTLKLFPRRAPNVFYSPVKIVALIAQIAGIVCFSCYQCGASVPLWPPRRNVRKHYLEELALREPGELATPEPGGAGHVGTRGSWSPGVLGELASPGLRKPREAISS